MKGYVLIVDDDEDARVLLGAVLNGLGFPNRSASDGVEALSQIENHPPTLILLDLMMPRMHGFDVVFHIRGNPAISHIPIVIFSAHHPTQEDWLKLPGVVEVIQKGGNAIEQVEIIAKAILNQTGLDHLIR